MTKIAVIIAGTATLVAPAQPQAARRTRKHATFSLEIQCARAPAAPEHKGRRRGMLTFDGGFDRGLHGLPTLCDPPLLNILLSVARRIQKVDGGLRAHRAHDRAGRAARGERGAHLLGGEALRAQHVRAGIVPVHTQLESRTHALLRQLGILVAVGAGWRGAAQQQGTEGEQRRAHAGGAHPNWRERPLWRETFHGDFRSVGKILYFTNVFQAKGFYCHVLSRQMGHKMYSVHSDLYVKT
jgi:hypothetical protein